MPAGEPDLPMENPQYTAYLDRYEEAAKLAGRGRKQLDEAAFERLNSEHQRLLARLDPDDIQLDEWKRLEELRFLLLIEEETEEE